MLRVSKKKKKSSLSLTMLSLELTVLGFNSRDQNVLPAPLGISPPPQGDGKLGTGTSLNSQSVRAAQVCRNSWCHELQPYILAIQGLYQTCAQKQWDGLNCSVREIIFETAGQVLIKRQLGKQGATCPGVAEMVSWLDKPSGGATSCMVFIRADLPRLPAGFFRRGSWEKGRDRERSRYLALRSEAGKDLQSCLWSLASLNKLMHLIFSPFRGQRKPTILS